MSKIKLLLVVCTTLCGCITIPNSTEVRSDIVFGQGHPSAKSGDVIEFIRIDLRNVNGDYLRDIWAATKDGENMPLADISIDHLKDLGAREWKGTSRDFGGTISYFVLNTHFWFDGERLIAIYAWEYPEFKGSRFGSKSQGTAIKLPCTLREFEAVFGKTDYRERYFHW